MTQIGKRTAVIPMRSDKGMWAINSAAPGDAAEVPDGYAISLHNYLNRPLRQIRRPPFVYDSLMSVANLLRWEDMTNQLTKTLAIDASQNLRTKDSTGLGYTATVVTGTPTGRLTDFANFLGKVYQMYDNGSGTPAGASVYDGSAVSASPFNTPIVSRTITAFIERLFLAFPLVTITPQFQNGGNAYDLTDNLRWTKSNITAKNIVVSGGTVCRLYLTSTTASQWFYQRTGIPDAGNLGIANVAVSAINQSVIFLSMQRTLDPTNAMPVTLEVFLMTHWQDDGILGGHTWVAGDIVSDGSGHLFRCTTGGVGDIVTPIWNTTVGSVTNDGATVRWTCEGSDVFGSIESFIPAGTDSSGFTSFYVEGVIPPRTNLVNVTIRCKYFNTAQGTITLAAVDVSFKDGLADSNPAKANAGQQVTIGDFYYPFFNAESASSSTRNLDAIVWSEIREPKRILAKNTFTLPEVAGFATAACQLAGRYLVFKRRGFWVFKRTTDKNIPILPEKPANTEVGCIGPRAWDTYGEKGDTLYWIGENGIYRMGDDWQPEEIGGAAMREEIMARGSGWVESQATYNVPILAVEHANKEVWIHTQAGKIYVYHIPTGAWSYIDVSGAPPIRSMFYDYVGGRMLVSFGGFGVTRLMETSVAKDTIDNTATPLTVTADVVYKPLELYAPRYEAYLEEVGVFHLATASQTGQTITPSYSYDRGATFTTPSGYPATVSLTSPRVRLPIGAIGPSVTVKVSAAGSGGQTNWSISKADAKLQVKRGELPYANVATAA